MADDPPAPIDEDIRHDDLEFNPALEPKKAKAWLNLLEESETAFERWNGHCDKIDKFFASLEQLASPARGREYQMFWANCEVIRPAIYARAPVPVVVPKFQDRRPVYQAASELLERAVTVAFDLACINDVMTSLRDDVVLSGRGVPWCRYESGIGSRSSAGYSSRYDGERVCIDYKHRRDFLHSISRCWYEVTWVAAASYLTRAQARERFAPYSGDAYQDAEYCVDKDARAVGGADNRERARFWEIWHKGERRVVWVSPGCENILDESDPHLDLEGFFPCPKPAYGVVQRGSLVPVPDMMQYKDQLDEINLLTSRIHALSDALEVKGFYPAGGGEVADAIEAALKLKTPGRVLVPIANWAAFGGSNEVIIWLPIDQIAATITQLVELRKQVVDDIYQIVGLSDIMRGATDPRETLGAQEMKSSYGSTRVRDKQYELERVARDLVRIVGDIICEKFKNETIVAMTQTQLPSAKMQGQAIVQLNRQLAAQQQQIAAVAQTPQAKAMAAGNPDQANQLMASAQGQLAQGQNALAAIAAQPTLEQVMDFLRDKRGRAFVLDIETDSTIIPNERAEKERCIEFTQMLGALLPQLAEMVAAEPATADFCGELLKFATKPFRAGRSLDGAIDDLVEEMRKKSSAPRADDPTVSTNKTALQIEQLKQSRQADRDRSDVALRTAELQMRDRQEQMKIASSERIETMKLQGRSRDDAAKAQQTNQKAMAERESHQMDMVGKAADIRADQQLAAARGRDIAARGQERRAQAVARQQQPPPRGGGAPP